MWQGLDPTPSCVPPKLTASKEYLPVPGHRLPLLREAEFVTGFSVLSECCSKYLNA